MAELTRRWALRACTGEAAPAAGLRALETMPSMSFALLDSFSDPPAELTRVSVVGEDAFEAPQAAMSEQTEYGISCSVRSPPRPTSSIFLAGLDLHEICGKRNRWLVGLE